MCQVGQTQSAGKRMFIDPEIHYRFLSALLDDMIDVRVPVARHNWSRADKASSQWVRAGARGRRKLFYSTADLDEAIAIDYQRRVDIWASVRYLGGDTRH